MKTLRIFLSAATAAALSGDEANGSLRHWLLDAYFRAQTLAGQATLFGQDVAVSDEVPPLLAAVSQATGTPTEELMEAWARQFDPAHERSQSAPEAPTTELLDLLQTPFEEVVEDARRRCGTYAEADQVLEWLVRFTEAFEVDRDTLDLVEVWLDSSAEWTEVGRGLWLPTSLVPSAPDLQPLRLHAVHGGTAEPLAPSTMQVNDDDGVETNQPPLLAEPPVEREADATVSWTQALRALHIQSGTVPVPWRARLRYPRFVGRTGPVAIRAVLHDTGAEGFLWLDRERNILFGDLLSAFIEWEEAGRRLHMRWGAEAMVIQLEDMDLAVQAEENRLVDLEALHTLRLELGESYRASLAEILRSSGPLPFRQLYDALIDRVGYRPQRASIRAVLSVCPEFRVRGHTWQWQQSAGSKRSLRRAQVLARLGLDPKTESVDLSRLAEAALQRTGSGRPPAPESRPDAAKDHPQPLA